MMKTLAALITIVSLAFTTYAQEDSTRGRYLGLDVINSVPTYVLPNWYYIRKTIVIEPYYRFDIKKPDASIVIGAGFAKGSTHQYDEFNPSQSFRGAYFRASYEFKYRPRFISVGYGPIISFAGYNGKFRFEGPTFGDYEGSFQERNNVAIGWEGYIAYDLKLSRDLSLRFLLRNVMGRRTKASVYVQYYPGFGYTPPVLNNRFLYSGGLSFQLYYKLR
ncbi:hypothetical protein GCM10007423_53930 [Dyadobacter endophyticus]|uniref:Outer membrane protein beta-barrel domain-containing protein n=1 Tax=Dyadobacter endophyticus TaxID=1749036 RepID=A0ABQ1Z6E1_9BACT|nr:hypothetical protein [Dyadobacter endophyticus]GGH50929.1 hypothetical protein GCM10007423_53930 [Dyadobacter endophyticus]